MTQLYMIPDFKSVAESAQYAAEQDLRFEYNDFIFPSVLDDEKLVEERIAEYKGLNRDCSMDTMHGAFFDVTVFSYDAKIREVSLLRMRQSMEIAKKMGLRGVVFHGNHCPFLHGETYDTHWLDCTEEAIRELAKENGFINADKPDSQDICFIPDGDYGNFIEAYRGKEFPSGEFVDSQGHVLGRHKGIIHYTVGQRKNLGIPESG